LLELNRAEALDLARHQGAFGGAELEEPDIDNDAAGVLDPVTIVVLTVGTAAIQGLIAWLLKNRKSDVIEAKTEIRHPDGTVELRTLKIRRKEVTGGADAGGVSAAEVLAQLIGG
jgi:hypothetical protein